MKRPPAPVFTQVHDSKVLDEYALVQFVCMTSIAKGEGAPVDINLLDLVDMSKAFAQSLLPILRRLLNLRNIL